MRIISGKLKGKSITFLKSTTTRPLKDFVKENIFNILGHSHLFNISLKNSSVLDLYSGVGSFGLECLSREAKKVIFVEKNKEIKNILEKNLINLSVKQKSLVIQDDVKKFLGRTSNEKFDIIFFDPPFAETDYLKELLIIKHKKLFKKKHLIIIHREKKSEDLLSPILKLLLIKKYGRSKIIFGKFLD